MPAGNCSNITEYDLKIVGITIAVAYSISILSSLFVLMVMVIYKKYVITTQRLILYLTITIMLDAIANGLMGANYNLIYKNKAFCVTLAFLTQYFALSILLSVACAIVELALRMICRRESGPIEWVYIPVIFLLPATISWIPFIHDGFGLVDGFCDILTVNTVDCTRDTYGLVLKITIWWVPLYLTVIGGTIAYVTSLCILHRSKKKYTPMIESNRDIIHQRTMDDVSYFKWYPLLIIVINLIPIINTTVNFVRPQQPIISLWVITVIIKGLQGGFLAIAFTLDPKTRKRLRWRYFRAACLENVACREVSEEYPFVSGLTDSLTSKASTSSTPSAI